jgi:hypothetical protein
MGAKAGLDDKCSRFAEVASLEIDLNDPEGDRERRRFYEVDVLRSLAALMLATTQEGVEQRGIITQAPEKIK